MPTLSTLKIFISLFFQWVISSNKHIDIQVQCITSIYDILYLSSIIYFKSYHLKLFHASMGIVHQLFVYSTIVFQKYNTFHMKWWSCFIRHYFEMLLFDEWLKWNIFHFFSTLNCQKESIDGKYIFQGAIIFIILGKGVPKT